MGTKAALAKCCGTEVTIGNLLGKVERSVDSICRRAYEFALDREFARGHDVDDWLKAENELFFVPASELRETETEYILKLQVAGFRPEHIAVSAEPRCITVWGTAATSREDLPDAGDDSEAADSKEMFFQSRLPHSVMVENAKAYFDSGELTVTLPKRTAPQVIETEQAVAA